MAISERARRIHDELFPGHTSTLAVTDPELIETLDHFAFAAVLGFGNLEARTRLWCKRCGRPAQPPEMHYLVG